MHETRKILQYIRKGNRKVGLVVAFKSNQGIVKVGYSLCHKTDEFDATIARNTAFQRAISLIDLDLHDTQIPHSAKSVLLDVVGRVPQFFYPEVKRKPRRVTKKGAKLS